MIGLEIYSATTSHITNQHDIFTTYQTLHNTSVVVVDASRQKLRTKVQSSWNFDTIIKLVASGHCYAWHMSLFICIHLNVESLKNQKCHDK